MCCSGSKRSFAVRPLLSRQLRPLCHRCRAGHSCRPLLRHVPECPRVRPAPRQRLLRRPKPVGRRHRHRQSRPPSLSNAYSTSRNATRLFGMQLTCKLLVLYAQCAHKCLKSSLIRIVVLPKPYDTRCMLNSTGVCTYSIMYTLYLLHWCSSRTFRFGLKGKIDATLLVSSVTGDSVSTVIAFVILIKECYGT